MANEKEETGKGQLGKPKDLTSAPRDLFPGMLNEDELNAKQDRLRIRRKKGPDVEDPEGRGLFDSEPEEDEEPTDCDE